MTKFKFNDHVLIVPYAHDEVNKYGRVFDDEDGTEPTYWVTNMNMPYIGTILRVFQQKELEKV